MEEGAGDKGRKGGGAARRMKEGMGGLIQLKVFLFTLTCLCNFI